MVELLLEMTQAREVLIESLPIIGSGEPVAAAVTALEHADALLVHVDGKPVGVITRQDLLGYLAR